MNKMLVVAAAAALGAACSSEQVEQSNPIDRVVDPSGYTWLLPRGFPLPAVPADNPMSAAKVELGRHLFYDVRLSIDGKHSCASCHEQRLAFTDGRSSSIGATGEPHARGSMSLANVAYASTLTWANPLMSSLEKQALVPMFGETPIELGLAGREQSIFAAMSADARYQRLLRDAFPTALRLDNDNVTKAIASFERSLLSGDSAYDRWVTGTDNNALSAEAKRGRELFFGERAECFHCHGGFNFGDNVRHTGTRIVETNFHNNGLYNIGGTGAYPADNTGVMAISGDTSDMGKFKAPSLRNVAVTAPYMHDGSIGTLREVIEMYARGGRLISEGTRAGDGAQSPLRSEFVRGFQMTEAEKQDLLAFLESLTDQSFVRSAAHANPW